jgi:hypothetical protein
MAGHSDSLAYSDAVRRLHGLVPALTSFVN